MGTINRQAMARYHWEWKKTVVLEDKQMKASSKCTSLLP
jgi:hypothetical protein